MFVEGEVEIQVKDRAAIGLDEHNMKLWVQRAFKEMSCYRISNFRIDADRTVRAVVALKLSVLPENERNLLETHANDLGLLRSFIEKMFEAKGTCRCIGEPKLKPT
ncbi:MAG: hypothetical protein JW841_13825 [Deltaproteobacteria bacterium]|nr:hypothetical protein [Deltaproteobacteria bacterium]